MEKYCLMYHPSVPVENIVPVLNLEQLLTEVNTIIKIDRNNHTNGQKNNLARTVRLNWMVDNLKREPVYKPIVTVLRNGQLVTVTGDTRLQAIELSSHITHVSCLASIPTDMQENFKYWDLIPDIETLASLINLPKHKIMLEQKNWIDQELDWIEFDIVETSTHMHDEAQRLRMIYNYLDQQSSKFVFSRKWLQTPIEWNQYDF
jgi:hypothetical protein